MNIVEPDVAKSLQLLADGRDRTHELDRVEHRHVKDFRDALALVKDFHGVAVVALAAADFAGDINIGQEMHLDANNAVTLASLAAAALDVEGETPWPVAAHAGIGQLREQFADMSEYACIRRRIRSRRAPDRALIDVNHLVQMLDTLDTLVGAR